MVGLASGPPLSLFDWWPPALPSPDCFGCWSCGERAPGRQNGGRPDWGRAAGCRRVATSHHCRLTLDWHVRSRPASWAGVARSHQVSSPRPNTCWTASLSSSATPSRAPSSASWSAARPPVCGGDYCSASHTQLWCAAERVHHNVSQERLQIAAGLGPRVIHEFVVGSD